MRKTTPPKVRIITKYKNRSTDTNVQTIHWSFVNNIGKNLSILYVFLIVLSSTYYYGYYTVFGVNLFDYLTFSELLLIIFKEFITFLILLIGTIILIILTELYSKYTVYHLNPKFRRGWDLYIYALYILFPIFTCFSVGFAVGIAIRDNPESYNKHIVNVDTKFKNNLCLTNNTWIFLTEVNNKIVLYSKSRNQSIVIPFSEINSIQYKSKEDSKLIKFFNKL